MSLTIIGALACLAAILAQPSPSWAGDDRMRYVYCVLSEAEASYYSMVFSARIKRGDMTLHTTPIETSFMKFVNAHFHENYYSGPTCIDYESRTEAKDALNDDVSDTRNDGRHAVLTRWSH
jgi:hypothetical protein